MEAETFSATTLKKTTAPRCLLCLKNYQPQETRYNLYSKGKSKQDVPLLHQFLSIGLDLSVLQEVSHTICAACCRKFKRIIKYFETLEQWRKKLNNEQPSTAMELIHPFKCKVCKRSFIQKGLLSRHMQSHRDKLELKTFVINPKGKKVLSLFNEKSSASHEIKNLSKLPSVLSEETYPGLLINAESPSTGTSKTFCPSYCRLCLHIFELTEARRNLYSTGKSGQNVPLQQTFSRLGVELPALKDVSQLICLPCYRKLNNILKCFDTIDHWRKVIANKQPSSSDHSSKLPFTCSVCEICGSFIQRKQLSRHMKSHKAELEQQFSLINPKSKEDLSVYNDTLSASHENIFETVDSLTSASTMSEETLPHLHSSESPFEVKIKIEEDL